MRFRYVLLLALITAGPTIPAVIQAALPADATAYKCHVRAADGSAAIRVVYPLATRDGRSGGKPGDLSADAVLALEAQGYEVLECVRADLQFGSESARTLERLTPR